VLPSSGDAASYLLLCQDGRCLLRAWGLYGAVHDKNGVLQRVGASASVLMPPHSKGQHAKFFLAESYEQRPSATWSHSPSASV
jgi:hypothetical protein